MNRFIHVNTYRSGSFKSPEQQPEATTQLGYYHRPARLITGNGRSLLRQCGDWRALVRCLYAAERWKLAGEQASTGNRSEAYWRLAGRNKAGTETFLVLHQVIY